MKYDLLVIGGGAAGFFGAIHTASINPDLRIAILERGKDVLGKVRISGGGRCNVTHAEYDPRELVANYPRGEKELLGPFHSYACGDTQEFFESRGVPLKVEEDGRIFPVSDSSGDIINCLLKECSHYGIEILYRHPVRTLEQKEGHWIVHTDKERLSTRKVLLATGSNTKVWNLLEGLGHKIVSPVPSLFTFNIKDPLLEGLPGLAVEAKVKALPATVSSQGVKTTEEGWASMEQQGPLLITHWGISGPGVLKLSAWGARLLHECRYKFRVLINWLPEEDGDSILELITSSRANFSKKLVSNTPLGGLPKRLWTKMLQAAGVHPDRKWAELSKAETRELARVLVATEFKVDGKSTFKEEFVTAGGVSLTDIDFRTFESKVCPGLYMAGEILDIDAITGGFNFQNAWTGAYIAARSICDSLHQEN